MKKYLKYITSTFLIGLLFVLFIKCDDKIDGTSFTPIEGNPIGLYLEENSEDFSLWVDILKRTDLFNTMNLYNEYTCFVPDNDAVNEFLNGRSLNDFDPDYLKEVVRYHTISRMIKSTDFRDGAMSDTTYTGDYLTVVFGEGGFNNIILNNTARIISRDIDRESEGKISNGVIHVIDKLMEPITETVYDKLKNDIQFSIFTTALEATGLNEKLQQVYGSLNGFSFRTFYTALAVPDAVYNENSISNYEDLAEFYKDTVVASVTDPENKLYKYVAYHILEGAYYYNNIGDFEGLEKTEKVLLTAAGSELIRVEELDGEIVINNDPVLNNVVHIDQSTFNVPAKNGTYHMVDNMMPVYNPPAVLFKWDPCDVPECRILDIYGIPFTTTRIQSFENGDVDRWDWNFVSGGVSYRVRDKSSINNNDWLAFSARSSGWLEITTPIVLKGKYKFTLGWYGCNKPNNVVYQVSVNGVKKGDPKSFNNYCNGYRTEIGEFELLKNQEVTVRFTMVKANGPLNIDYVEFEPIAQ